uniref:Amine oxidase domain-containing protein n=1 Tax=Aegilops tauschii subsp. strangulata TaxID=200361 RepID=A0A453JCK0_AEGTS
MTLTRATAALVLAVLTIAHHASLATAAGPKVIIVGAGMSGISAGKRLSEAGITDLVILEATDHVGGRMHKRDFGGISVEMGANWVEGVDGGEMNPIWPIVNSTLKLTNFRSDFDHLASNVYKEKGGVYKKAYVQKRINLSDKVEEGGQGLACLARPVWPAIMSILAMQRLNDHLPNGPSAAVDMILDYFKYDYEFAEPPRVTSLQNTIPLATFSDFGDDVYFVADQRGYEAVVYHLAGQYLKAAR